jgi:hypothetical protein
MWIIFVSNRAIFARHVFEPRRTNGTVFANPLIAARTVASNTRVATDVRCVTGAIVDVCAFQRAVRVRIVTIDAVATILACVVRPRTRLTTRIGPLVAARAVASNFLIASNPSGAAGAVRFIQALERATRIIRSAFDALGAISTFVEARRANTAVAAGPVCTARAVATAAAISFHKRRVIAAICFVGAKWLTIRISTEANVTSITRSLVVTDRTNVARCILPFVHASAVAFWQ